MYSRSTPTVPIIGAREPAKVLGMTILVVVECQMCLAKEQMALVNAQSAMCPACKAILSLDAVEWDQHRAQPKIALTVTPAGPAA